MVWIRTRCYSGSPTTAARTLCCVDPRTAKCSCFPSALLLSQTTTMTPGPSVRCCLQGRLVATTSCQQYMMLLTPQHQLPIETTPHTRLLGNMQCALQQQTESVLQCCTREHTGHPPMRLHVQDVHPCTLPLRVLLEGVLRRWSRLASGSVPCWMHNRARGLHRGDRDVHDHSHCSVIHRLVPGADNGQYLRSHIQRWVSTYRIRIRALACVG